MGLSWISDDYKLIVLHCAQLGIFPRTTHNFDCLSGQKNVAKICSNSPQSGWHKEHSAGYQKSPSFMGFTALHIEACARSFSILWKISEELQCLRYLNSALSFLCKWWCRRLTTRLKQCFYREKGQSFNSWSWLPWFQISIAIYLGLYKLEDWKCLRK